MFCKFQHHSMYFFLKMANKCFLKTEKGCIHPPTLWLWRLTLPLGKVAPPFFFFLMKMTAKDVKEIICMPLITFFSVLERPEKNRKGVATTPRDV